MCFLLVNFHLLLLLCRVQFIGPPLLLKGCHTLASNMIIMPERCLLYDRSAFMRSYNGQIIDATCFYMPRRERQIMDVQMCFVSIIRVSAQKKKKLFLSTQRSQISMYFWITYCFCWHCLVMRGAILNSLRIPWFYIYCALVTCAIIITTSILLRSFCKFMSFVGLFSAGSSNLALYLFGLLSFASLRNKPIQSQ